MPLYYASNSTHNVHVYVLGWHYRINRRSNGNGLAFYVLGTVPTEGGSLVDMQVRLVQDGLYTRDNRAKYCRIQTKLNELWTWYEEGALSTSELLQGTSEQYSEFK